MLFYIVMSLVLCSQLKSEACNIRTNMLSCITNMNQIVISQLIQYVLKTVVIFGA